MTTKLLLRRRDDDTGTALMLTIFTMLLVTSMSLTVGSAVLLQVRPTQLVQKSTRTITAAEAGFDVALNRIRSAQDLTGTGVRTLLPCTATTGTVLTGRVANGADAASYSVRIRYYNGDPSGKDAAWRSNATNLISCASGAPASVPLYALLESTGSGAGLPGTTVTANRTVEQVYRFQVSNVNVPGGLIINNTTPLCIAAASHQNGASVRVRTCDATGTNLLQKWSYTNQLLLQTTDASGNTFCIQGSPVDNAAVTLTNACNANRAVQVWSFNDIGRFAGAAGAQTDGSGAPTGDVSQWCLTVQTDRQNDSPLIMKRECGGSYDSKHTFNPEAKVGAGKAGDNTKQLVNYRFFGRCFDVTSANVGSTWLIGYPCKQAPSASFVKWNQKMYWDPVVGKFCTNNSTNTTPTSCAANGGSLYCLSAGTNGTTPTSGVRALVKSCNSTDSSQKWTRRYDTGTYATSYNILTERGGLCLDLNPTGAAEGDAYIKQWGIILASTCDGSTRQKWNAPADLQDSSTINTYEKAP